MNTRVGPNQSLFLLNDLHPHVFLTPVSGSRNVRSWYLREAVLEVTTDLASGIWAHYPRLPAIWLLQGAQACNLELISEYQSAAQGVVSLCSQMERGKQVPGQRPSRAACSSQPLPQDSPPGCRLAICRITSPSEHLVWVSDPGKHEQVLDLHIMPTLPHSWPIQAWASPLELLTLKVDRLGV